MKRNRCTMAFFAVIPLVIGGVIAFNVLGLHEAYGSGSPYFSRTTNMDKWPNPLPEFGIIDGIAVLLVASYFYVLRAPQTKKPRTNRG